MHKKPQQLNHTAHLVKTLQQIQNPHVITPVDLSTSTCNECLNYLKLF